jgi:nucleoside-triphosphatase
MSSNLKILLTGLPGCGKTTAVRQIVDRLKINAIAGFYTQEIRENDERKGFRWATFDGAAGILAHVNIKTPFSVGRYRVDVAAFEKEVVPVLDPSREGTSLFIIDEIGKMECMSGKFVNAMRLLFASEKSVLATVALKGTGLISDVKTYPGIRIFELTHRNRDRIIAEISQILSSS